MIKILYDNEADRLETIKSYNCLLNKQLIPFTSNHQSLFNHSNIHMADLKSVVNKNQISTPNRSC